MDSIRSQDFFLLGISLYEVPEAPSNSSYNMFYNHIVERATQPHECDCLSCLSSMYGLWVIRGQPVEADQALSGPCVGQATSST